MVVLISILEFVIDCHITFTFSNEVDMIIAKLCRHLLSLFAKDRFWCLEHGVHSLNDVVDYFLIIQIILWLVWLEYLLGDGIRHDGLLEDLD